ncbi:MAG: T9SS type A sorting domain-containing protein [Candidatus Eisenbacteria bacterium]
MLKSMALGDIDEDGRADLIVSTYADSSLGLLRSLGGGALSPRQWLNLLPLGKRANSLDLVDRDGDGHLDLVACLLDSLKVFKGYGNGAFTSPLTSAFAAGEQESNAGAWGDVNDDGRMDFLSPSAAQRGVVLIADGVAGGGFAAPQSVLLPQNVTCVRMADANADGRLDLFAYSFWSDSLTVLIALPNGNWTNPITSEVPQVRGVGDQDGDGRADLWSFPSSGSKVWRGIGNGKFAPGPLSPAFDVSLFNQALIADQNGDGRADMLCTVPTNEQGAFTLLRSQADGSLFEVARWGVGASPIPFALADIDGDGLLDAACASRDDGAVVVLLGQGPERFAARTLYRSRSNASCPASVGLADLDRDGRAELLFQNSLGNQLTVYRGSSTGLLDYLQDLHTPNFPEGLSVSDLDGNGWPDVLISSADGSFPGQAFALNQGNGSLMAPSYLSGLSSPSATQALAGEFDNTPGPDLLYSGSSAPRIAWYQGPGSFTPLMSVPIGGCAVDRVAVGRVDFDALDDVVFVSSTDSMGVAVADGQRGLKLIKRVYVGGTLMDIGARDLNADGRLDVVVLDATTSTVAVLRAVGTGVFAPAVRYAVGSAGTFPLSVALGDLDVDGYTDLIVSNGRSYSDARLASATVWYNDHQGGFIDRADLATGPYGGRLSLGDVDGNGTLDLAVANGRGSLGGFLGTDVSILINSSAAPPVAVGPGIATSTAFAMPRAWPNPLRRGVDLRIDLVAPARGEVAMELLDLQGRRIREQKFRAIDVGPHTLTFASQGVAPGLYFIRAQQGAQIASQRVVVLH